MEERKREEPEMDRKEEKKDAEVKWAQIEQYLDISLGGLESPALPTFPI